MPKTRNKDNDLAHKIAKAFNEEDKIQQYVYTVNHYKRSAVERAFKETMLVPDERITKTRAALFFHILKNYDKD